MSHALQWYGVWLADYYLLSAILLVVALTGLALVRQPAQRIAVAKSALVALVLLAGLCALPGWSVVHLLTAEQPRPAVEMQRESVPSSVVVAESARAVEIKQTPVVEQDKPAAQTVVSRRVNWSAVWQSWPIVLPIVHLLGAVCVVMWLGLGYIAAKGLRHGAREAPADVVAVLSEVTVQGRKRSVGVQLLVHDRLHVAVALGIWRPLIFLPRRWTESESHDHLRTVLAHELTHVFNYDLQWVAVSRVLLIAFWANPLFWIARRRLRLDQEALADASAAEITSRQRYAEQLVAWAKDARIRPAMHLSSAVGLWEGPSQLRQRIAILLNDQLLVLRNCSRRWKVAAAMLAVGFAMMLSKVTLQPTTHAEEKPSETKSSTEEKSAVADPLKATTQLRLQPNTIIGQVLDEKSQPIAGAESLLFRINRIDSSRRLVAKKSTDAEGKYRFENVIDIPKEFPDGKLLPLNPRDEEFVQVYVRAPGRGAGMRTDMRQNIASAGVVFDMTLTPGASLSGRVTGPDGKPVGGARVMVGDSGFSAWEGANSARTKSDGTYVINDVPPYSMNEYRKKQAEQQRSTNTFGSNKNQYSFFVMPPVMTVEHPEFAIRRTTYDKIPGTQDVTLEPAAIVEGRVVFGDSGKPAAGAIVHLATARTSDALPTFDQSMSLHRAEARADAEGKYKFAMLPAGSYDLYAELPNWVNVGIDAFAATAGKTSTAPNLNLTAGGIISIRFIDDKTGQPIALTPDVRADISAVPFPFQKRIKRMSWTPNAAANSAGRFELRALPGKRAVMVSAIYAGEKHAWASKPSPGELKHPVVDVVESKTVEVDIPVVQSKVPRITGSFQVTQPEPPKKPEPAESGKQQAPAGEKDGTNFTPSGEEATPKELGADDGKTSSAGAAEVALLRLPIRVLDEIGAPIAGATVEPLGVSSSKEAPIEWKQKTDDAGMANVPYPRFAVERYGIPRVSVRVQHPEFVARITHVETAARGTILRLGRGGAVEVTARAAGGGDLGRLYGIVQDLDLAIPWTRKGESTIASPHLAAGDHQLRVVSFTKDGGTLFSESQRVTIVAGEVARLAVELRPGWRIDGRLSENVPRPVKDGRVLLWMNTPAGDGWHDSAAVSEDGTFSFESLPPDAGAKVGLAATCQRFVSKQPPDAPAEAAKDHVVPQRLANCAARNECVLEMAPTTKLHVRVVDTQDRAIRGVKVYAGVNTFWENGSFTFAAGQSVKQLLTAGAADESASGADILPPYQAVSGEDGVAMFDNLPPLVVFLAAYHDQYEQPIIPSFGPMTYAKLKPGQTTNMKLAMLRREEAATAITQRRAMAQPTIVPALLGAETVKAQERAGDANAAGATKLAEGRPADTEIAGRVEGPNGKPLAGVTVDVWTWYRGNETKTDDQGRFSLKKLEANQPVEIEFRKKGFGPRHFINQNPGTPGWVVQMDNTTYLEGQLTDAEGKIVANSEIRAERGPFQNTGVTIGSVTTVTRTDKNGQFRLYLEPDRYDIKIRVPGRGAVRFEDQPIAHGEKKLFNVNLGAGETFRANVLNSATNKPVEGIVLWSWQHKGIEGKSHADGLLEIPAMFAGNFQFQVTGAGVDRGRSSVAGNYARWWSADAVHEHQRGGKKNRAAANPGLGARERFDGSFDDLEFKIGASADPVTIFVEPCVTITGRVVDPDSKPVGGATVAPALTGTGNSLTGDTRFSYTTKADGTFEMKLPSSGDVQYNLIAHDGKYGQWRQWANGANEPFRTSPGQRIENVELRLTRPATVRGRVLTALQNPVAGKEVRAADVDKHDNRYYLPTTKTDKKGNFELKFVHAGKHYIQVDPFYLDPDQAPDGTSAVVEVKEGATIDNVLIAPRDIRDEVQATAARGPDGKDVIERANTEVPKDESSNKKAPVKEAQKGAEKKPVEIPIIVAKHVLLHDGTISEWADLEKLVAALPDPTQAHPAFYFTHGAIKDRQEEIRAKVWDFRKRQPMNGHSWSSIAARTSVRYDAIRTADDLEPNAAWRIDGVVQKADGKPASGAEVLICPPVDESIPYKTVDIYMRNERLRNALDEIVTTADDKGHFAHYPNPATPYYVVALHKEGFALVPSEKFLVKGNPIGRIILQPWAKVSGRVEIAGRFEQTATATVRVPATNGLPELTFHQYSADLGPPAKDGQFNFGFLPPSLSGTLSRSIKGENGFTYSVPAKELRLKPGESFSADIGSPTEKDLETIEFMKSLRERESAAAKK